MRFSCVFQQKIGYVDNFNSVHIPPSKRVAANYIFVVMVLDWHKVIGFAVGLLGQPFDIIINRLNGNAAVLTFQKFDNERS